MKPINLKSKFLSLLLSSVAVLTLGTATARGDTQIKVGVSIGAHLPRGAVEVSVGRDRYYTHRGVYYRPGPNGYVVVRAPRGIIIRELPPRTTRIHVGSRVYYRHGNVYYERGPAGYVVVDAPVTFVRESAAPKVEDDFQSVWAGDKEYRFRDGQFFKSTSEGLVWVEAPLGALTKTLPADAQSVWHEEVEYFECDDVYFRKTPDGYKVVEAPWRKP